MKSIALLSVIGILILHFSNAIPMSSVGGPLTIAAFVFTSALAVGIHEAWTERRGIPGWLLNIVIALIGAFFGAQLAGLVMVSVLAPFMEQSSLAAAGGNVMAAALVGTTLITLLSVWGLLQIANRWRK